MMELKKLAGALSLAAMVALAGCAGDSAEENASADGATEVSSAPAAKPSPELMPLVVKADPPPNQVGVAIAKEAPAGDDVVVEGRLKDFIEGKAAFTMVDGSIDSCADMEDDHCPTPWDYCCVPPKKLTANTATVTLVDEAGKVLDGNLQGVNSIDHLTTVVVTGKLQKDEAGNVTIAANQVYLN